VKGLGDPIAYLALEEGVPVYASDGAKVGKLTHVLADEDRDIFEGLVIATRPGPGGHRYVDESQIAEMHENGVLLGLDPVAAGRLPEPSQNPVALAAGADETVPDGLDDKLRRAWARISGDY
jgi:hypothetical protein